MRYLYNIKKIVPIKEMILGQKNSFKRKVEMIYSKNVEMSRHFIQMSFNNYLFQIDFEIHIV